MVIAVALTLLIAVLFPLLNPQPKEATIRTRTDVKAVAQQAGPVAGFTPLAVVPAGWSVNFARWKAGSRNQVPTWEVGYTTDRDRGLFVTMNQSTQANPTWRDERVGQGSPAGRQQIAGLSWETWRASAGLGLVSAVSQPRPGTEKKEGASTSTTVVIFAEGSQESAEGATRALAEAIASARARV